MDEDIYILCNDELAYDFKLLYDYSYTQQTYTPFYVNTIPQNTLKALMDIHRIYIKL